MRRLQEQMKELMKCQGHQTKKYVEAKLNKFIETENIDIQELNDTLAEIKKAIEADDNTFKLIQGIIDTNKSRIIAIATTTDDLSNKIINQDKKILNIEKDTKECLRIAEEDFLLDVSELCDTFSGALFSTEIDVSL